MSLQAGLLSPSPTLETSPLPNGGQASAAEFLALEKEDSGHPVMPEGGPLGKD